MSVANSMNAMYAQNKAKMSKGNQYFADIELIVEEEGFNTRDYGRQDVQMHIRNLADAYKRGEDLGVLKVKSVDGKFHLREGHCRRRAITLANSEGADIKRVAVMEVRGDEIEQDLVIITSQMGLKLTALEQAAVYIRLLARGLTEDEIAKRVAKTKTHVQQYLQLYDLPLKLKDLINQNHVSWSLALELYQEHGTKAVDMLLDQVENAGPVEQTDSQLQQTEAENDRADHEASTPRKTKRVTRKLVDAAAGYRSRLPGKLIKQATDSLSTIVLRIEEAEIQGDEYLVRLTKEQVEGLMATHSEILPKGIALQPKDGKKE